jgi:hypothetical protein
MFLATKATVCTTNIITEPSPSSTWAGRQVWWNWDFKSVENSPHTTWCTYFWPTPQAGTLQQLSRSFWIVAIQISTIVITYLRLISMQSRSDGSFWLATHARVSIDHGRLYCGMHLHNWCRHGLWCLTFNCIVAVRVVVNCHMEGLVNGGIICYVSITVLWFCQLILRYPWTAVYFMLRFLYALKILQLVQPADMYWFIASQRNT